jgi:hypothetical protein
LPYRTFHEWAWGLPATNFRADVGVVPDSSGDATAQNRGMTTNTQTTVQAPKVSPGIELGSGRQIAARVCAIAAAVLGLAYAAVSIIWAFGGNWLLDTVGGELAAGGRAGAWLVIAALWAAIVAKLVGAVLPLVAVSRTAGGRFRRPVRLLCGVEAVVLTTYGLVLTVAGVLVQSGVIQASADADHRALAWHAYLWDPWFAIWGILVGAALLLSRPRRR